MQNTIWKVLTVIAAMAALSACAPLIGGGAAVVADQVAEDENGGDGLF